MSASRVTLALLITSLSISSIYADMSMSGFYGPYTMSREASGTSWQPDDTPHQAIHWMAGDWKHMIHGYLNGGYTHQGGERGSDQGFITNMFMWMAARSFDGGSFGVRTMMSLEPAMGPKGYPLLLQTGETANGQTPLIDRQHPHDLFDELALTGNLELTETNSVFGYAGLPGEPALGPPTVMHRLSGADNPLAPIGHHWMDSTHVTYGVLTGGFVWGNVKLEGSGFRGREPDQHRWNIEEPKIDSWSGRFTINPTKTTSAQVSYGRLKSPDQLFPTNNTDRATASLSCNRSWVDGWSGTTLAWGRNWQRGIDTLNAYTLESALNVFGEHTFFSRFEYVEKDDLLPSVPLTSPSSFFRTADYHPFLPPGDSGALVLNIFPVKQFTLGYIYDFSQGPYVTWGVGGSGMVSFIPQALRPYYGSTPFSYTLFLRLKLGTIRPIPTTIITTRNPWKMSKFLRIAAITSFVVYIGFCTLEVGHHHDSVQQETHCVICQVIHQTPVVRSTPALSHVAVALGGVTLPAIPRLYHPIVVLSTGRSPPAL